MRIKGIHSFGLFVLYRARFVLLKNVSLFNARENFHSFHDMSSLFSFFIELVIGFDFARFAFRTPVAHGFLELFWYRMNVF